MRARCIVLLLCLALLTATVPVGGGAGDLAAPAPPTAHPAAPDVAPGQLVLGFRPEADEAAREAIVAAHGGRTIAMLASLDARVVALPGGRPLGLAAAAFAAEPLIRYAEPNARYRPAAHPDDPSYLDGTLWGLDKIAAPAAWATATGDPSVVVGVVDSGIDTAHPDLVDNIWSAPAGWTLSGCAPGTHGYSALNGTVGCEDGSLPAGEQIIRDHGTHVAGVIGAAGNNGVGVVGVSWRVGLMSLRCADPQSGAIQAADAARVIAYAVAARQAGVNLRVLNLSWTASAFSQVLLDAIGQAGAAGILVVAAAGDTDLAGADTDQVPQFPASYAAAPHNAANVIAVTATDRNDAKGLSANYGRASVHLGAPGGEILSTVPGNGYLHYSGTSLAVAHVSGAAALLAGAGTLALPELRARLLGCGDPVNNLASRTITGRRLNVARAVANADCLYALVVDGSSGGQVAASPAAAQYLSGSEVVLTATPQEGYRFDGWTLDGAPGGAENPLTLAIWTDRRVAARFSPQRHTLTVGVDVTVRGTVGVAPPGPTYAHGETVTLTADPAVGFRFVRWTFEAGTGGEATANPLTLAMLGDRLVRAEFAALPSPSPSPSPSSSPVPVPSPSAGPRYILELAPTDGGTIAPSVPGPYPAGSRVALAAQPQEGYRFVGWAIDGVPAGATNPLALVVDTSHRVAATFVRAHPLTLAATSGGSVAVAAPGWTGGAPYPIGTALTLTATTATNGVFTGWTIDGAFAGWASPLTLTMDAPHVVVATFAGRPRFGDLPPGPPPYEAIAQLAARGIILGYENGDFGPDDLVLRAQMAALIVRALDWGGDQRDNPFTDRCLPHDPNNCIDADLWRAIGILAGRGVARGYGDGTYGARDPVLHVQTIAFIARAMVQAGHWTPQPDDPALYPNVPPESGHREDLATWVRHAGAIPGTDPAADWPAWDAPATRGWFALALWQALERQFNADRTP